MLGKKLGPILFQLPPRWGINVTRLEEFLIVLPKKYRFAFEFRDKSWFDQTIYDLLSQHHAAFCLYHLAGRWAPAIVTADFVYIRLHGPESPYQGEYDDKTLLNLAKKCVKWSFEGNDVYCYFDNAQKGYAVRNAMKLKQMTAKLEQAG